MVERKKRVKTIQRTENKERPNWSKAKYKIKKDWKLNTWRPTKKTKELIEKLVDLFSIDCTDEEACALVGITTETFYKRMNEDKKFSDTIIRAKKKYFEDIRRASKDRAMNTKNRDSTDILFKRDERYKDRNELDVWGEAIKSLLSFAKDKQQKRIENENNNANII